MREERVRDIASAMLDSQGSTFACHKTTVEDDDSEDMDSMSSPNEKHCAGALIFMEKNGACNQISRIMERLRAYDAKTLMADKAAVEMVFDDLSEMLKVNQTEMREPLRKAIKS